MEMPQREQTERIIQSTKRCADFQFYKALLIPSSRPQGSIKYFFLETSESLSPRIEQTLTDSILIKSV